jgi:hypothetical protein
LRELVRIRDRLIDKQTVAILKKYSVPSKVRAGSFEKFYDKKIGEGKHHFSALNAVAAKLLRITYWVLKNNKEYQTQLN